MCLDGLCTAVDVRETDLMSCETSEQCRLRWGANCCEYCASSREMLIAVSTQVDYEARVCPSDFSGCPPCVPPPFPVGVRARCTPEKRCEPLWIAE
jgi:hypothetical protein